MDVADTWKCDSFFVHCGWILNSLLGYNESKGTVDVFRNNIKILSCTLIKNRDLTSRLDTYFKENPNPDVLFQNFSFTAYESESQYIDSSMSRSFLFSGYEWTDILHKKKDIIWWDNTECNFILQKPAAKEKAVPVPNPGKWNQSDFSTNAYIFLYSILKNKEAGHIKVYTENKVLINLQIFKDESKMPCAYY
jgi:hypothetical protein